MLTSLRRTTTSCHILDSASSVTLTWAPGCRTYVLMAAMAPGRSSRNLRSLSTPASSGTLPSSWQLPWDLLATLSPAASAALASGKGSWSVPSGGRDPVLRDICTLPWQWWRAVAPAQRLRGVAWRNTLARWQGCSHRSRNLQGMSRPLLVGGAPCQLLPDHGDVYLWTPRRACS